MMIEGLSFPLKIEQTCTNALDICDATGSIVFQRCVEEEVTEKDTRIIQWVVDVLNEKAKPIAKPEKWRHWGG